MGSGVGDRSRLDPSVRRGRGPGDAGGAGGADVHPSGRDRPGRAVPIIGDLGSVRSLAGGPADEVGRGTAAGQPGDPRAGPGISAAVLNAAVSQQVLRALTAAGIELSLAAADDIERERARLDAHWKAELERAR